jgi:hypothetical protein
MAGEGMSLPPEVLQMLLPYIMGSSSQQKSALDVQGKGVSNTNSLLEFMLSPEFSAITGLADPMGGQSGQPSPYGTLTQRYIDSADPALADIAQGITSGAYRTPEEAKAQLRTYVNDTATGTTVMPDQVNDVVDNIFADYMSHQDQIAKWQQDQTTVWQKYGLPDPTDQYSMGQNGDGSLSTNMPFDGEFGQKLSDTKRKAGLAEFDLAKYKQTNDDYRDPTQRSESKADVVALEKALAELKAKQKVDAAAGPTATGKYLDNMGNDLGPAPTDPAATYMDSEGNLRPGPDPNNPPPESYVDWYTGKVVTTSGDPANTYRDSTGALKDGSAPKKNGPKVDNTAMIWTGRGLQEAQRNAAAKPNAAGDYLSLQQGKSDMARRAADAEAFGRALVMGQNGRSPLTDALMARFMAARQMGITG